MGQDDIERGVPQFFDDFRNSMYAAWRPADLLSALAKGSDRYCYQIVPRGLPTMQFLIGLPPGGKKLYTGTGFPWPEREHPLDRALRHDWNMLRLSLKMAAIGRVPPAVP